MADGRRGYLGHCAAHGKQLYVSRKAARRTARRIHDSGLREYPCDVVAGCWHIGHLPKRVVKGGITAPEIYCQTDRTTAT